MESASSKAAIEREHYMGQVQELLLSATNQELRLTVQYLRQLQRIHF